MFTEVSEWKSFKNINKVKSYLHSIASKWIFVGLNKLFNRVSWAKREACHACELPVFTFEQCGISCVGSLLGRFSFQEKWCEALREAETNAASSGWGQGCPSAYWPANQGNIPAKPLIDTVDQTILWDQRKAKCLCHRKFPSLYRWD